MKRTVKPYSFFKSLILSLALFRASSVSLGYISLHISITFLSAMSSSSMNYFHLALSTRSTSSLRRVDQRNFPTSLSQNCTETSRFIQLPLFSPLILTQVSNDRKYLETSFSLFLEIALLVFHDLEVSYIWF